MRGASAAAAFQMFNTLCADREHGILSFKKERRRERDDKERVRPRVEKLLLRGSSGSRRRRRRNLFFLIRTARHFYSSRARVVPLLTFCNLSLSIWRRGGFFFFARAKVRFVG